MIYVDPDGEPWNGNVITIYPNEGEVDSNLDNYRSLEKNEVLQTTVDEEITFSITYSMVKLAKIESAINLARTVWVIIVLAVAAIHFNNATNRLVLHPLERMLEIVKAIAKDPSSAAAQEDMKHAGVYSYMN